MKVLLDMDGVITLFIPALLEQYNFLTGETIKEEDVRSFGVGDYVNDPYLIKKLKNGTGFIRGLKPRDGAIDAINHLVELGHEVLFVSCPTNCPTAGYEKREWLNYYFSKTWKKAPLILVPPAMKKHIRGDVLLDDDPKNLEDLHGSTKGLLWHTKQNASVVGFDRIYSFDQFIDWVERNG
jgi:5'(3')-deoxyribonucleotidase